MHFKLEAQAPFYALQKRGSNMMNAQKLAGLIQKSHRIVALTGAGISTAISTMSALK
jgi:hypothetical protein